MNMEIPEILDALRVAAPPFPHEAVQQAVAKREEITPHLLGILEDTLAAPRAVVDHEDDCIAHVYAMFLLAQFRETLAYPLLAALAQLPAELADELFIETTSGLGRALASVCGGDVEPMKEIVRNSEANEFVRWGALTGFAALATSGELPVDQVEAYFESLLDGEPDGKASTVWSGLVSQCLDLGLVRLKGKILRAMDQGWVDTSVVSPTDVERELGPESQGIVRNPPTLVNDTVKEMQSWACFQTPEPSQKAPADDVAESNAVLGGDFDDGDGETWEADDAQEDGGGTIESTAPRVGRNEACPCGSGKKYKKCCGKK